jgi:hypothetical protein
MWIKGSKTVQVIEAHLEKTLLRKLAETNIYSDQTNL